MQYKINNDYEAWDFLTNHVKNVNHDEFRIHTNKSGLRLYLKFSNKLFSGEIYKYYTALDGKYHKDLKICVPNVYCETVVGKTLTEILNKHFELMPGNVLVEHEFLLKHGVDVSNEMTIEQFILNDLTERRQFNQSDVHMQRLKQIYNF